MAGRCDRAYGCFMGATQQDLADRTRQIMADQRLSWKTAWRHAESELGPADPLEQRQRRGCLLGGLRGVFWVIIGFVVYVASVVMMAALIPAVNHGLSGVGGFIYAVPAMILGVVVAILLAHRFPDVPTLVMAGVVVVVAVGLVGLSVYQSVSTAGDRAEAAQLHEDLVSALDRSVASVTIPEDWEAQFNGMAPQSREVGLRASSDLGSSGTWLVVSVHASTDPLTGDSAEETFLLDIKRIHDDGIGTLAHEPLPASVSGVPGYLYEISGMTGAKTGQELGAFLAIFFGPDYTYEVMLQFEIPDRDEMSALYRQVLAQLILDRYENAL
jgi:hypothetical protein